MSVHRVVDETCINAVSTVARGDRSGHGPSGLVREDRAGIVGAGVGGGVAVNLNGLCVAGHDEPFITVNAKVKSTAAGGVETLEFEVHIDFARVKVLAAVCRDGQQELAGLGACSNSAVTFFADTSTIRPAQVDLDVGVVAHNHIDLLFVVGRVGVLVRIDRNHHEVLTHGGGPRDVGTQGAQRGRTTGVEGVGREGRLVTGRGVITDRNFVGPGEGLARGVHGLQATGLGGIGEVDVQGVSHVLNVAGSNVLHDHLKGSRLTDEQLVTAACCRTSGFRRLGDAEDVDVSA